MMKKLMIGVIALFLIGCATGRETTSRTTYSTNLGTGTAPNINNYVPQIFNRYNFETFRSYSEDSEIYYESSWKVRDLFEDERQEGFNEVRSRIIVRARPRGRDLPGSLALFAINFSVENETRTGTLEWVPTELSQNSRDYFREISLELKALLESGFRTY